MYNSAKVRLTVVDFTFMFMFYNESSSRFSITKLSIIADNRE